MWRILIESIILLESITKWLNSVVNIWQRQFLSLCLIIFFCVSLVHSILSLIILLCINIMTILITVHFNLKIISQVLITNGNNNLWNVSKRWNLIFRIWEMQIHANVLPLLRLSGNFSNHDFKKPFLMSKFDKFNFISMNLGTNKI